jgi:TatD DNase family protein
MLIDSHAHLEMGDFEEDRDEVISRAATAGVERIVTVGTTLSDCRKAVEIAHRHPSVYVAIGIHPHEAKSIDGGTYDGLKALAKDPCVVAWGEIGLDFFHRHSPPKIQLKRFEEQLRIAEELALPFIFTIGTPTKRPSPFSGAGSGNGPGRFIAIPGTSPWPKPASTWASICPLQDR